MFENCLQKSERVIYSAINLFIIALSTFFKTLYVIQNYLINFGNSKRNWFRVSCRCYSYVQIYTQYIGIYHLRRCIFINMEIAVRLWFELLINIVNSMHSLIVQNFWVGIYSLNPHIPCKVFRKWKWMIILM